MSSERKAVKYHARLVAMLETLLYSIALGGTCDCSDCKAARALLAEIDADKP